jgi:hypothetical protein
MDKGQQDTTSNLVPGQAAATRKIWMLTNFLERTNSMTALLRFFFLFFVGGCEGNARRCLIRLFLLLNPILAMPTVRGKNIFLHHTFCF